jgi:hypothetical protein
MQTVLKYSTGRRQTLKNQQEANGSLSLFTNTQGATGGTMEKAIIHGFTD